MRMFATVMGNFMRQFLVMFLLVSSSCNNIQEEKILVEKNDTTQALSIILDSAFTGRHLYIENFVNYKFGDSIIFVDDSLIHNNLQNLDKLKFKLLTRDSICKLATLNQEDSIRFPDILSIPIFKKTASGYHLMLESQCVIPLYDKMGKLKHYASTDTTQKCWYRFLCTSSMSLTLIYRNDSLICTKVGFGAS